MDTTRLLSVVFLFATPLTGALAATSPGAAGRRESAAIEASLSSSQDQRGGPTRFGSGVRIDWNHRTVEVDAVVVLRKGLLELLACTPQTREHESILAVRARPVHVFQAMGLIGLTPGAPVHYNEKHGRWVAPRGQRLRIEVRYPEGGGERTVPVESWLLDVEGKRPLESVDWVFAGSRTFKDGRFGADIDGTVVCVVDFETALITVGALHSADNTQLWLAANTEAIPPVDTPCTLVIRRAGPAAIEVSLGRDGVLRRDGAPISATELAKAVRTEMPDSEGVHVVLLVPEAVPEKSVQSAMGALAAAGLDRASIQVRGADTIRTRE